MKIHKRRCKATIVFGDDYGDNTATFYCQLESGHEGPHKEVGDVGYSVVKMPYTLTWEGSNDELEKAFSRRDSK
jgi:hypothetical protein